MPRKNVSQMERTHSDEEESVKGDTESHHDTVELQANAAMANLQTILQELREFRCENEDT